MTLRVERQTVDLGAYPDLIVIYLGMQVRTLAGVGRLFGLRACRANPVQVLQTVRAIESISCNDIDVAVAKGNKDAC